MLITEQELPQIRNYIIKVLPDIIRQEPEIATTIEGILAHHFPRRDEFARLLDELRDLRLEQNRRFEKVDRDVGELKQDVGELKHNQKIMQQDIEKLKQDVGELKQDVGELKQDVGELKQDVGELKHNQKIMQQDIGELKQDVGELKQDVGELKHNQKIMQQDIGELKQDVDELKQNQKDFKQTQLGMKRDIAQLRQRQDYAIEQAQKAEAWLRFTIGDMRNEKGKSLEDMFAVGLSYGLNDPDIVAEMISLRQDLVDEEGLVFPAGYATEVDLIARNGELIVFEVKSTSKPSEIDSFYLKVRLITLQNPQCVVRGVFVSLGAWEDVRERCRERGIELLD